MPTYDYECADCKHQEEIFQKFAEKELDICPSCNKSSFRRVILEPPLAFIKGDPTSVGQLADRNTKKMGKYELEDKCRADNMETHKKNKEASTLRNKINKMTTTQKKKYIEKGE